jgi:hypothetical protein
MLRCVGFLVARMSEGKRSACIGTPHTSCGMAMALWESVGCGIVTAMAFLAYTVLGRDERLVFAACFRGGGCISRRCVILGFHVRSIMQLV